MTEKSYGGNNGVREHLSKGEKTKAVKTEVSKVPQKAKKIKTDSGDLSEIDSYIKAGEIMKKIKVYAKDLIKPGIFLLEIAQKIENEIRANGAEPAFPVNLSINELAAHYHPTLEDKSIAEGLLKVDIGIHINGFIADSAFSMDLTPDKKFTELIKASEAALDAALATLEKDPSLNDIGGAIQRTIEEKGFSAIVNLSGHGLEQYNIHAGITIPNYANGSHHKLDPGAYAIEPFATTGTGKIYEGPSSNIFAIVNYKNPRGPTARKILEYVGKKYRTLPFSLREIQEKFGPMSRLAMRELEQMGIVHNFPQLIEVSKSPVSQAEHSFVKLPDGKIIVTTR